LTIKATATLVSKASRDSVWKAMEDLESYPKWADSTRKTRIVSVKIVSREGNTVVCDVDELVGGHHAKHRGRLTFYPKEKWEEEFMTGGMRGSMFVSCAETPQGTRIDMGFDAEPNSIGFKLLGLFMSEKKMMEGIANEYCKQLSDYAEAHPSQENPSLKPLTS
jgi:hypothetical protein